MTAVDLFNTLEDLKEEEFKKFKWHLHQDILEGYQSIKVAMLENAERQDTVDVMVNTYQLQGALKVTKKVLELINRNDLVQSLPHTSSGPEGPTGPRRNDPAEDSEKRLKEVRTEFVKRVSNPVLNQLLDKLLERDVITDEEMQSVRAKVGSEKAREVIDTVRGKGSEASLDLIAALCEVDPVLSRTLGLI
ncbi:hypothetical protein PFLUV_G00000270 [Perca fluviatilis]|uniref:CARD domain-containing protein n=1 Tax=Perca fluviatilis TaxID=8168 RepID=A0A6A5FPD8_PERFL|nr:pyrin-like [Perca fluviatilis]KAF1394435.1 hypothetical protein PFLUV_G00000270 [Perca fluviatilis]